MDYIYASDPQKKRRIITSLFSEKFPRPTRGAHTDAQRNTPAEARRPVTINKATP